MTNDQLERNRMQKLRENLQTTVSDARNYLNRFFGAKVCGKCEGCSGGNCDACQGKPVVSLWDAASSAPAVEDVQSVQIEKPALNTGAEKTDNAPIIQLPVLQMANEIQTGREPAMAADDSRLIHLNKAVPAEATLSRLSGASLLRAGLNIDQIDTEKKPPSETVDAVIRAPATRAPEQVAETRLILPEQAVAIQNGIPSMTVEPALSAETPRNDPKATSPERTIQASAQTERAPLTEKTPANAESASISTVKISIPPQHNRPQTILENPCMQAIIKIKYSGGASKAENVPAPLRQQARKMTPLPQAREREVKEAIKAVARSVKLKMRERPPELAPKVKVPRGEDVKKPADLPKKEKAKPETVVAVPNDGQLKAKPLKTPKSRESEKTAPHTLHSEKRTKRAPAPGIAPSASRQKKKADHTLILLLDILSRRRKKAHRKAA